MNILKTEIFQNSKNKPLIVGLSGGADSMALLDSLDKEGFLVIAVHLNHGIRENSDEDDAYLKRYCSERKIQYFSKKIDILSISQLNKQSVEEAGRIQRYQYLFEIAKRENAGGVLVAHHFDDQAESLLMHLLRGSGVDGLIGMSYYALPHQFHSSIPLLRPFIETTKKEILSYCNVNKLEYLEDSTNYDLSYRRNKIRHEIFPVLESYNPQVKTKLVQFSNILRDENDFLNSIVEEKENNIFTYHYKKPMYVEIDRENFNACDAAIQKRLLKKAIKFVKPKQKNIGYRTIVAIRNQIAINHKTSTLNFEDNLHLTFDYSSCYLAEDSAAFAMDLFPQIDSDFQLKPCAQRIDVSVRDQLIIEEIDYAHFQDSNHTNSMIAYVDGSNFASILITSKQSGDRIQPFGMNGQSKKISPLFIDLKIHREARAKYPIFRNENGGIFWIPGFKISYDVAVNPLSNLILRIQLIKK